MKSPVPVSASPTAKRAPLFLAVNAASGRDSADDANAKLVEQLREAGHAVTLFEIPSGATIADACTPLVKKAVAANGIVVAAGGDGTVNAIATLCYRYQAVLGVIPLGTFNYFARALNIPTDTAKAIEVLGEGTSGKVSAGFVQEHLFLNNASFGLYPKIIRKREQATARYGRKRIVAAMSAAKSLFEQQKHFAIRLHMETGPELHRTNMVFVGNNTLQLDNLGLEVGECTRQDKLAVVILKRLTRLQTARLIWRGIVKNLKVESKLEQFCSDGFEVETNRARIDVAVDGEIVSCATPLRFRVEPHAIHVMMPQPEDAPA